MRIVLIVGAGLCCLPGLYILFGIPYDIIKFGIGDRTAKIALIFYAIYLMTSIAPAILLFKSRKKELSILKILAIGTMEFVVLLGLLFGVLFFSAGV